MANEAIELYTPGTHISATAVGAITGKTFVNLSGNTLNPATGARMSVAPATAAGMSLGVAVRDAANGAGVMVIGEGVVPVTAGGTIAAGAEVEVGANSRAVTLAAGRAVGRAFTAGTSGNDVYIKLYL